MGTPIVTSTRLSIFISGYCVLIGVVAIWARVAARKMYMAHTVSGKFNRVLHLAQMLVPAWFGLGVFYLGWAWEVQKLVAPIANLKLELPELLLGVMPAMIAWAGLWWAQYPMDRAMREQNVLDRLDADLPVYTPPTLLEYLISKTRMQLLFTAMPVLLIVTALDVLGVIIRTVGLKDTDGSVEMIASIVAVIVVFMFGPWILRRVLATSLLADPELSKRLTAVADIGKIRYRKILLWHTHHCVGNAAVMGVMPSARYVLMSDLLVESLNDDELAAVFAHEVGHVVHRHMAWYAVFFVGLGLASMGFRHSLEVFLSSRGYPTGWIDNTLPFVSLLLWFAGFGFVSRRFERQADVYAARTMQKLVRDRMPLEQGLPVSANVEGAAMFNAALLRVSEVNNLPLEAPGRFAGSIRERAQFAIEWISHAAGSWLHGSMASRMRYITRIGTDAKLLQKFDRQMIRVRWALVIGFIAAALWGATAMGKPDHTETVKTSWSAAQPSPTTLLPRR